MSEQVNLSENKITNKVSYTNDFKQQVVAVYIVVDFVNTNLN